MKDDVKQVHKVARKHKMTKKQRREFSDYIHKQKKQGNYGSGKNGDFTYGELDQLAKDFLQGK